MKPDLLTVNINGEYVEGTLQEIESIEHHDGYITVKLCNGETRTISSEDPIYTNLLGNKDFLLEEAGNIDPYKKER